MQTIHVKPEKNWMNDPNGFIYYKGEYHLFYQHFPYGSRWGRMHWYHVVSKDLVHWENLGIALYPSKTDDRSGCFSGSAVEDNGKLYLYYTGVNYLVENPEDINLCIDEQFDSAQLLITSEDGYQFDNIADKKTVVPVIRDPKIGDARHTRDPKVWKEADGCWYMVLGSTIGDQAGRLLFYRSKDKENWEYVNSATKENMGWMWECPDYFEVNGKQILVFSPMGILKDGKQDENHAVCMQVSFDKENCRMELPETYQFLDYGLDLYAPQSTTDEEGRRVLMAWLRMPTPVDGKWQGMMSIPRVVEAVGENIYFRPHPNIQKAYTKQISTPKEAARAGYRLRFSLRDKEEVNVGGYRIFRDGNRICTDRKALYGEFPQFRTEFATPELKDGFELEVYVDPNLIEVFANQGEAVISNTVYHLGTKVEASENVTVAMDTIEE